MNVRVVVDGRCIDLEIDRQGDRCAFRRRDGPAGVRQTASLVEVEPAVYSVLWEGRAYEARIETGDQRKLVAVGGRRFEVEVADPRRSHGRSHGLPGEGRISVSAPMPGRVVRVLVADGDTVEAGQGLVVVEAMKMQNEMKAPKSGRVAGLRVREGEAVAAGEVLATIE